MKKLTETRPKISLAILFLGLAATSFATAADLNVPTTVYPAIQAAVNAAHTNDTIHIAPGVYTGQVLIFANKLTLIGQPGTVLRATENMPPFSGSSAGHVPIIGILSSQVTVRGLTFEGERLAERFVGPGVGNLMGIYFRQSSGNVENCAFYGFRESTPGKKLATAIGVNNADNNATEVNFRLVGSTFADNYNGVYFIGSPTKKNIDITVENNTIIGPGSLNSIDSLIGILVREGAGGRIVGNSVSGYSYVGTGAPFPISLGILVDNEANFPAFGIAQPVIIEGNTLRDNQRHIALIKGDNSVVRNNRFQGTAPGIIPVGLAVTGKGVTIANNQFEGMKEGIRLMGNDPNWGTLKGIAVNAQVTSNCFSEVTTPVTIQPLANATEAGTLLCPFPPPTLAIAPAVLSWPAADDGWTVESATSVVGPWADSDATPFTQYGRHNSAVPTDGEHWCFHLH